MRSGHLNHIHRDVAGEFAAVFVNDGEYVGEVARSGGVDVTSGSVRDEEAVNSQRLMLYNVQAVPDFFLIDRGNNLVKRAAQIKDLEAEIKKLL